VKQQNVHGKCLEIPASNLYNGYRISWNRAVRAWGTKDIRNGGITYEGRKTE